MTVIPSLPSTAVIAALERAGWQVQRQRGSHIRLKKVSADKLCKLTISAHRPIKRSTLAKIIKQADMMVKEFLKLLLGISGGFFELKNYKRGQSQ